MLDILARFPFSFCNFYMAVFFDRTMKNGKCVNCPYKTCFDPFNVCI